MKGSALVKPMAADNQVRAFSSLQYAYREMFDRRLIAVSLSVLVAAVLTFSILGPLGFEDSFGPFRRLAFVASCGGDLLAAGPRSERRHTLCDAILAAGADRAGKYVGRIVCGDTL